ncbi:MAG TPA: decaprenyl-phosphate phosphoribosyltransferase [Vicinamibacterales bacterium]|nr:decaprenyl-phosphate phosphoribosyltransferase [Vicinamibacterales bacterium]
MTISRPSPVPTASLDVGLRGQIGPLLQAMRPEQWTKNLLVFAGLIFAGRLFDLDATARAFAGFAIFCGLSAAVYLLNDILDHNVDRQHPLKRSRPVASGELSVATALSTAVVLGTASLAGALALGPQFALTAFAYLALFVVYSVALKHVVIVDVLTIAAGFVLRSIAGAVVLSVPFSSWLLVCSTLLALFLALSKRRHELTLLGETAIGHRRILQEYSPYLLDQMISVVTASTLIAYSVYATSADTAARLGTTRLGLTIPFVLYGIFRYLYLVHQKSGGGSPSALLLTDRSLLTCVALWTASVVLLLYSPLGKWSP